MTHIFMFVRWLFFHIGRAKIWISFHRIAPLYGSWAVRKHQMLRRLEVPSQNPSAPAGIASKHHPARAVRFLFHNVLQRILHLPFLF